MMSELKPCPFCGSSAYAISETDADDIRWHFIRCRGCGVRTRGKWHSPGNDCPQLRAEVRDEWNHRATEDKWSMLARAGHLSQAVADAARESASSVTQGMGGGR